MVLAIGFCARIRHAAQTKVFPGEWTAQPKARLSLRVTVQVSPPVIQPYTTEPAALGTFLQGRPVPVRTLSRSPVMQGQGRRPSP